MLADPPKDPLEWLRQRLDAATSPEIAAQVRPLLAEARRLYGGDSVYIRARDPAPPTRRTLQLRRGKTEIS